MKSKRILITGARFPGALDLARKLYSSGHDVFVAESTRIPITRFSNSVEKAFLVPSSRFKKRAFLNSILKIVKKHQIELIIPIFEEIFILSKNLGRFPETCKIFCDSFTTLENLHNKWLFHETLEKLGLNSPKTYLIQSKKDFKKLPHNKIHVLKTCYCRACQTLIELNPDFEIPKISFSAKNPWIAQEWITGEKFCTYSICQNGSVLAHSCYPVTHTMYGHTAARFQSLENKSIEKWVKKIVKSLNYTGQIAFDLIQSEDGTLHPIECNPRATSGLHLFDDSDRIDRAFLSGTKTMIRPEFGREKQMMVGMMLHRWQGHSAPLLTKAFWTGLVERQDISFQKNDILPFMIHPLLFVNYWIQSKRLGIDIPSAFTHDLEWNGENLKITS